MDLYVEDMLSMAKVRVNEKGVTFKGIAPKKVGAVEIAVVGKAKVVACAGATQEQLLQQLKDEEFCKALQDTWVLVVRDCAFCEEFAKIAHPYVTISNEKEAPRYEAYSRGWNVDCGTECMHKKCVVLGIDGNVIEVLFGESRENPIGLLSIKCINE